MRDSDPAISAAIISPPATGRDLPRSGWIVGKELSKPPGARASREIGEDARFMRLGGGFSAPERFAQTMLAMADIAYDVLLDTGIHVQPLPIWEEEWAHPETYSNPRLLRNIARDGVRL